MPIVLCSEEGTRKSVSLCSSFWVVVLRIDFIFISLCPWISSSPKPAMFGSMCKSVLVIFLHNVLWLIFLHFFLSCVLTTVFIIIKWHTSKKQGSSQKLSKFYCVPDLFGKINLHCISRLQRIEFAGNGDILIWQSLSLQYLVWF